MPQNKTLNAITTRAKQIRKKHPGMSWISAVKKSSQQLKGEGKIGAAKKKAKPSSRQTGTSNSKRDKERTAKPPGLRIVKHGKKKTTKYYERRKNRSDKPGKLQGIGSASMYSVRDQFERDIKGTLFAIDQAKKSSLSTPQKRSLIKKLRVHLSKLKEQLKYQNQLINNALR